MQKASANEKAALLATINQAVTAKGSKLDDSRTQATQLVKERNGINQ